MANISNEAELKATIRELELKTMQQEKVIKESAKSTAQSFQPANLVKIGLVNAQKVAMSRDVRAVAINTFIGFAAGYVTKRFVLGKNPNILRRTLGVVVQTAITKMVYKQLPTFQHKANKFIATYKNRVNQNRIDEITSY